MTKKIIFIIVLFFTIKSYAGELTLREVLENPDVFDKQYIEIEGEVIGEILSNNKREEGWINISDDGMNIGVFSENIENFKKINFWGKYKEKGDRVRIKGDFFKACEIHQMSGIHLETLDIASKGYKYKEKISPVKIRAAIISFIIGLTTTLIYFINKRHGR